MRRLALIFAVALLTAAFIGNRSGSGALAQNSNVRSPLKQPSGWVPFSADVETTTPGIETLTGRYFRNSEGSERFEATRPSDGTNTIEILNLSNSTYYANFRDHGWISRPMDVSVSSRRPMTIYSDMPRLVAYPYKLDIRKGGSRSVVASQGLDGYMYTTASGNVHPVDHFPSGGLV